MRELLGKIGRFCENHVEKIVLVIVGAFCAWLFFTRVIFSPNGVPFDGKVYPPGQIDAAIQQKAQNLAAQLQGGGTASASKVEYIPRISGPIDPNDPVVTSVFAGRPAPRSFMDLFKSPLDYLVSDMPLAETVVTQSPDDRPKYTLPRVGPVRDVAVQHLRAAAYVPVSPVTMQNTYDNVDTEPNDIDLVTVEARFDVAELYRQFHAHFAGTQVERQSWRDPCLANPKFAAVQLQRQTLLDDGSWSDWVEVPRSRIDSNRSLFQIIENVQDLPPGGLGVRMMQYNHKLITMSLLQPESYQIASAEEEWLPPTYYAKYMEVQRKIEAEEKRKEREDQRDRQETQTGGRRDTTRAGGAGTTTTPGGRRRDTTMGGGGMGDPYGGAGGAGGARDRGTRGTRTRGATPGMDPMMGPAARGGARAGRPGDPAYNMGGYGGYPMDGTMRMGPSPDEVYFEFAEETINFTTDLSKRKDPLLFWAFDDTMDPGHTYRYRIRLGVFNPVAGMDMLAPRDAEKKSQAILWSDFSQVTEPVAIPKRLYFFAKDVQDQQMTATVEVARYKLGYWRTEDFQVRPGDAIGKEVEPKKDSKPKRSDRLTGPGGRITGVPMGRDMGVAGPYGGPAGTPMYAAPSNPADAAIDLDVIDFSTDAILIDLVQVNDWDTQPNLRARTYYDLLYTRDGIDIQRMPVSTRNWPRDLLATYQFISMEKRKEPQTFKSFQKGGFRARVGIGGPGAGGYGSPYDMMGGAGPYGPMRR
ncbi:MAG: hypothetical protein RBR19_15050 [Sedimentisphaerales bacterium]|jgi:hypothetical protein|nr:hypothetical protein [Sedimentisphaerales bacterium]NLT77440.1 hypothetical protein [Planctomycetota bacterium]